MKPIKLRASHEALTPEHLKEGRLKALANARELVDEAQLLHASAHWPRVVFLCHIAAEELGKYIMLISAFVEVTVDPRQFDWNRFWKRFTNHRQKFGVLIFWEDLYLTRAEDESLSQSLEDLATATRELDTGKQKSLYTDITGGSFHSPRDLMGRKIASIALGLAQKRADLISSFEERNSYNLPLITSESVAKWRTEVGLTELWQSRPLRIRTSKQDGRTTKPRRHGS